MIYLIVYLQLSPSLLDDIFDCISPAIAVPAQEEVYWDLVVTKKNASLSYTATVLIEYSVTIDGWINGNFHEDYRGEVYYTVRFR